MANNRIWKSKSIPNPTFILFFLKIEIPKAIQKKKTSRTPLTIASVKYGKTVIRSGQRKIPDARFTKVIEDCFENINGIGRSDKHNNKPKIAKKENISND